MYICTPHLLRNHWAQRHETWQAQWAMPQVAREEFWPRSEAVWPLRPLYISLYYTEMTEYQVPGCWLVTSEVVTSTSEAVTSTMEAQSKHDEIQEKMAATRGAIETCDEIREKKKDIRLRAKRATYMRSSERSEPRICEPAAQSGPTRRASN